MTSTVRLVNARSRSIPCCSVCKQKFEKKQKIVIHEEQISWFRGDDNVTAYCLNCSPNFNKAVTNAKLAANSTPTN